MAIFLLSATYNRSSLTYRSVSALVCVCESLLLDYRIVLVDNNSSDDTFLRISQAYTQVDFVFTPSNMYWSQSMRYGWSYIRNLATFRESDLLLAFNDDIDLDIPSLSCQLPFAINSINNQQAAAIAFSFYEPSPPGAKKLSYGGLVRRKNSPFLSLKRVTPECSEPLKLVKIDTYNMNLALHSCSELLAHGFISPYYVHGAGDYALGLRLSKSTNKVFMVDNYAGCCHTNTIPVIRFLHFHALYDFYAAQFHPKSLSPMIRFRYYCETVTPLASLLQVIAFYVLPLVRTILPTFNCQL